MSIRVRLEHNDKSKVLDMHTFKTLKSARKYAYAVLKALPDIKSVCISRPSSVYKPDWSEPSYVVRGPNGFYYLTKGNGNGHYIDADGLLTNRTI